MMNEKELNELNNFFDSLDYELTMQIAKCEKHGWLAERDEAKGKLNMLIEIRSKIAEITKE